MAYLGVSPSNGVRKVHTYTATASQTTFSGAGAENISLSYRDSTYIDVYQNGVKLGDADYTATSGTSVVLGTGASADDLVVVVVYDVFSVADTVSKTDGGTFDGAVTFAGDITDSGDLTVDVAGDLTLDVGGADIIFKDDGTQIGRIRNVSSGELTFQADVQDKDIVFNGNDGGSTVTALTLDMSDAGKATFNSGIVFGDGHSIADDANDNLEIKSSSGENIIYDSANGGHIFKKNGTEQFRIDDNNKVGIGTSGPSSKLHIKANSSGGTAQSRASIIIEDDDGNADSLQFLSSDSGFQSIFFGDASDNDVGRIAYSHSGNTMRFNVNGSEAMRIENDGQLSVGGTGGGTATIYVLSSDADAVSFFQSSSNDSSGIKALQTSINQNAGNTNCQHLRATTQNIGTFRLDGNGASTFTSDERLKKNIETTRDGYLEDLAKLRVVKYNWHCHDEEDKKELGLIAQEVQKIFPKLVVEDEQELNGIEKPLAVKLSVLPMMLLKALQEANTKITALESRITALEGE